jgi:hypothetical protein
MAGSDDQCLGWGLPRAPLTPAPVLSGCQSPEGPNLFPGCSTGVCLVPRLYRNTLRSLRCQVANVAIFPEGQSRFSRGQRAPSCQFFAVVPPVQPVKSSKSAYTGASGGTGPFSGINALRNPHEEIIWKHPPVPPSLRPGRPWRLRPAKKPSGPSAFAVTLSPA